MNKNNKNDNTNKSTTFNDKIAIFNKKNSCQINIDKKKEDENYLKQSNSHKYISNLNNIMPNDNKKITNEKKEEKERPSNKIQNFVKQFDKNKELNNKKTDEKREINEINNNIKEKTTSSTKNFQENLKLFNENNDNNKNKKETKEISHIKENKNNINNSNKKETQKKEFEHKKDNNEIEEKKIIPNNIQKNKDNNFKDKLNIFNRKKEENNKINNYDSNLDKPQNNNYTRYRSTTILDKVNLINATHKEDKDIKTINQKYKKSEDNINTNNYQNIKNENTSPINTNKYFTEKNLKKENEIIIKTTDKENKKKEEIKINCIKERSFLFSSQEKPNIINNNFKDNEKNNIISQNLYNKEKKNNNNNICLNSNTNKQNISSIQQRILEIQKKNNMNKNKKEEKKQLEKKRKYDPSILEKLKIFYKPDNQKEKQIQEKINSIKNNSNLNDNQTKFNCTNLNNDNKVLDNKKSHLDIKKNVEDNKINLDDNLEKNKDNLKGALDINKNKNINKDNLDNKIIKENENKNKNFNADQIISKKEVSKKEAEMTVKSTPKKLILNEIFKNMNKDQIVSNLKIGKREEIIKLAKQKKEEEEKEKQINSNEIEVKSDNKNEELIEDEKENLEKGSSNEMDKIDYKGGEGINRLCTTENESTSIGIYEENSFNPNMSNFEVNKDINHEMSKKNNNNNNINQNNLDIQNKEEENENNENKTRVDDINENKAIVNEINDDLNIENEKQSEIRQSVSSNIEEEKLNLNTQLSNSSINNSNVKIKNKENNKIEKSLEISNEDTFLEKINIPENDTLKINTFCESLFLASFSKENGKILEYSEDVQSECNHFICSILPAMQPEIIYKYPKEDIKGLEINNIAASICFPNGVKICYEDNEENIKTVKNFRSSFTNQVGERFFVVTYHFYLKMNNNDFENEYDITPIKYQLTKYQDEYYNLFKDEVDEDIYDKLNYYGELSNKEYIYIPYCFCLISKYPFIEQMEKCLESIMISINKSEENIGELNKLIIYIVKSIPAPPIQSKIFFPLPYHNKFVEIQQPYFRDIIQFGNNPIIILNHLSVKHTLYLFKLLLFEQKILIVGKNNDLISQIILNFVSLLYPFEWIHTFIPIMSEKMLKFLQAFLPFFNGINRSLFIKAKAILTKAEKGVFIFDIDDDKIEINNNYKNNTKFIKASTIIKKNFECFPKTIENLLMKELKTIKSKYDNAKENYDKYNANLRIKHLFMYVFVELLNDYKKYSFIIEDYPVFNSFLMIKDQKSDKKFFKDFSSSQLFQMFIQNSLIKDNEKNKTYFEELLEEYTNYKSQGLVTYNIYQNMFNKFKNEYLSFFEIKKNYIIKPYFNKEFEKFEENYINKKKNMKLSNISLFLSKQYESQSDSNINSHGVLRENRRIMEKPMELNNEDDPKEIDIFIFPGKNFEDLINDKKKKNSKNTSNIRKTKTFKLGIISEENGQRNNIKITHNISNNEYDLSEDDKDEIKDNIKDIMARIYRSEISKLEENKKTFIESMKTQFGRDYFVSILNTGNIYKRDIKVVIEEVYDFFSYVIYNTLLNILNLEENQNTIYCAVKLLKASLCIKTFKNKKEYLLSDELFSKLETYSLINKQLFWKYWVEDEMTISDIQIFELKDLFTENCESFIDKEESEEYKLYLEHSYNILESLPSIMLKMKLKITFIISTIYELGPEYLINKEDNEKLLKEIKSEIELFKQLIN